MFTGRCALSPYIKQIIFVFNGSLLSYMTNINVAELDVFTDTYTLQSRKVMFIEVVIIDKDQRHV